MYKYISKPCSRCGCCATGSQKLSLGTDPDTQVEYWDPPQVSSCDCECHLDWRKINGVPAEKSGAEKVST